MTQADQVASSSFEAQRGTRRLSAGLDRSSLHLLKISFRRSGVAVTRAAAGRKDFATKTARVAEAGGATPWFDPATPVNFGKYLQGLGADITAWSSFSDVLAISADGLIMYGTGTFNGATTSWRVDLNGPCPATLNGDGLVEDGDFVLFAGGYDALECP